MPHAFGERVGRGGARPSLTRGRPPRTGNPVVLVKTRLRTEGATGYDA